MLLEKNIKWHLRLRHVVLIAFTLILALLASVFVYASQVKEVEIDNKGKKVIVKTMGKTVGDILRENEIKLDSDDIVEPKLDHMLGPLDSIAIRDAALETAHADSRSGISEAAYLVNNEEAVTGDGNEILQDKTTRTEKVIVIQEEVPYKTVKKANSNMKQGQTKVVKAGKDGLVEKSYQVVYRDGKEVSRKLLGKKVVSKSVDKLVEYGTASMLLTSRGDNIRYKKCLVMSATAYDASYESTGKSPGHPEFGITATGIRAKRGVVAVDPRVIPLGTRLYIESMQKGVSSYGYAVAADTGGAIKGNKIDLFFETSKEVNNWGRRNVKVYILE